MSVRVSNSDINLLQIQKRFKFPDQTKLAEALGGASSPDIRAKVASFVCQYFFCQNLPTVLPIVVQWVSMMVTHHEGDSWEKRVVQWIQYAGSALDVSKPEDVARVLLGIWPEIRIAPMETEAAIVAMRCICRLNEAEIGWIVKEDKFFKIAQGCESGSRLNQAVDALIALNQGGVSIHSGDELLEALLAIEEQRVGQIVDWVVKLHKARSISLQIMDWRGLLQVLLKFDNTKLDRAVRVKTALREVGIAGRNEIKLLAAILECKGGVELSQATYALITLKQSGVFIHDEDGLLAALLAIERHQVEQMVGWIIKLYKGSSIRGSWSKLVQILLKFNSTDLDRIVQLRLNLLKAVLWIDDEIKFLEVVLEHKNDPELDQAINVLIAFRQAGIFIYDGGKSFEALLSFNEKNITKILRQLISLGKAGFVFRDANWSELFQVLLRFSPEELDRVAGLKLKLEAAKLSIRDELGFLKAAEAYKNDPQLDRTIDAVITLKRTLVLMHEVDELFKALLPLDEKSLAQVVGGVIELDKAKTCFFKELWSELFQVLLRFSSEELAYIAKVKLRLYNVIGFSGNTLKFLEIVEAHKNDPKLELVIDGLALLRRNGAGYMTNMSSLGFYYL